MKQLEKLLSSNFWIDKTHFYTQKNIFFSFRNFLSPFYDFANSVPTFKLKLKSNILNQIFSSECFTKVNLCWAELQQKRSGEVVKRRKNEIGLQLSSLTFFIF